MRNKELREYAARNGVRLWQIASRIGVNDGNFSRKLRTELSDEKKQELFSIIDEIVKGREDD